MSTTGFSLASFEVPDSVVRQHYSGAGRGRGVFLTSTTTPDTIGVVCNPIPHGYRHFCLHRRTNAPRFAGKLGRIVLSPDKPVDPFDMVCAIEPNRGNTGARLYGAGGNLAVVQYVREDNSPQITLMLLDRERVAALWGWLQEWMRTGDDRHSAGRRRGVYFSVEEENADRRLWREMREAQDRADEGYDDDVWARETKHSSL